MRMTRLAALALLLASGLATAQHKIEPEVWIEMRKMFRKEGPVPTIAEDIAALAGREARRAGPRLIDHGPEALPQLHAALLSPDLDPKHAHRLLQVVNPIGDPGSVTVVLKLLRRDPESPLRRTLFLSLTRLPATKPALEYIVEVASDENEAWQTRRTALAWFGLHRHPRGRPLAEALTREDDPEKVAGGLYILARLGETAALQPIAEMLATGAPGGYRDLLLVALAELTTPEEYERMAPASLSWSSGYKDGLAYTRYRHGATDEQAAHCIGLLRAATPGYMAEGVRCLLDGGHADELRPLAALDMEAPGRDALLRNEIRKAGWVVIDTDSEFSIVPASRTRR